MTEVLFYHLELQPMERVISQLLEKTLERGWRAVVEAGSRDSAEALDTALWTYRDDSFLPHGLAGDDLEALHPVLITADGSGANGATVRFFVDRAVPRKTEGLERVVYLFSGHDPDAVAEAREAWKSLRDDNTVTYWQQGSSGRWEKKA